MPPDSVDRFVPLTTVGDVGTARVLAAVLSSEGIEARVHGEPLGPYPVTVGKLAETQIWVLGSRLDEARQILLEAEIDESLEVLSDPDGRPAGAAAPWRFVAAGILVVIAAIVVRLL